MFGPLQGITDAIGEELTELCGFRKTRLTEPAKAEALIDERPTADYDGGLVLTLPAGTFASAVGPGQGVRVLSGPAAGQSATIAERVSDTELRLSAVLGPGFTGEALEVRSPPDSALVVESTRGFSETACFTIDGQAYLGRVVVDGCLYYYSAMTATRFVGLMRDEGTGALLFGVGRDHVELSEVDDFSKNSSALDGYRRGFCVKHATGADLTAIGNNLGVPRPEAMSEDEPYRALIQAMAYCARGTVYALELVLKALFGEGFTLFEDLTIGAKGIGKGRPRHGCTVFLAAKEQEDDPGTEFVGETWLDGFTAAHTDGGGTLSLPPEEVGVVCSVQTEAGAELFNRPLSGATLEGSTLSAPGQLSAADLGRFVVITEAEPGQGGGAPLGSFVIAAQDAGSAELVGPLCSGATFTLADRSRLIASGEGEPFVYPRDLGQGLEIVSGVNKGRYQITDIIDPVSGEPFRTPSLSTGFSGRSSVVVLSGLPEGGLIPEGTAARFRIIPNGSGAVQASVVGAGSASGGQISLAQDADGPQELAVYASRGPSGYLTEPSQHNALIKAPSQYALYPAYLPDAMGYARSVVDALTAAGVIAEFDALHENQSGTHVRKLT